MAEETSRPAEERSREDDWRRSRSGSSSLRASATSSSTTSSASQADFENYRKRAARDQEALVARAHERLVKELLPVLDDLERALEAAERARGGAARGGRPARPPRAARRAGEGGAREIETDGEFDPHVHEALLTQPPRRRTGAVLEVIQKGYRLGDRVLRPARVVVSQGPVASDRDLYEVARRSEDGVRGRDQEGVPQARPQAPPGLEPGRRGGGGALQGAPGRLRRALRPGEAQAVRRVRLANGDGGRRAARGGFTWCERRRPRRPRRPVRRALRRGAGGAAGSRPQRGQRGADVGVTVTSPSRTR